MSVVATRRFFNYIDQWRVGISSGDHHHVSQASGIGPVEWVERDPYVRITIPGASQPVFQLVGNADVAGWLDVRDYEAVKRLLYETDVTGSTETAVSTGLTSRHTIGYFAIVVANEEIVNVTDTRTNETSTFVFNDARIGQIVKRFTQPYQRNAWRVHFMADYVIQVDT